MLNNLFARVIHYAAGFYLGTRGASERVSALANGKVRLPPRSPIGVDSEIIVWTRVGPRDAYSDADNPSGRTRRVAESSCLVVETGVALL